MTEETRLMKWGDRLVRVTPVELRAVQLLKHVEGCVWAQGLGPPAEAHELRHALDDAFKHRPEAAA